MIRVDTFDKVVIIDVGGKIGNPLFLSCLQPAEPERIWQHPSPDHHAVSVREGWCGVARDWAKRQIRDDFGPPGVLRTDAAWTTLVRLAVGQEGVENP
jgi:hypothetical protein